MVGSGIDRSSCRLWWIHASLLFACVASLLTAAFLWLIPMEVVQQWAFERAGSGALEQFEAVGKGEFSLWLCRISATVAALLFVLVWSRLKGCLKFFDAAWRELSDITEFNDTRVFSGRIHTFVARGMVAAWMLLFAVHAAHGIGLCIHDWPYFRFNSGNVVLPNISDSNRAVIRYVQESTPPNARILVASDQKLFFLSYYLRPRTLFHRMHPDSEHVIPLKDQERKLVAFRLEDLSTSDLSQMPHEYTLEYFEHPDFVDRSRLLDDTAWVAFIRNRERNLSLIPAYEVRLRKVREP